MQSHAFKSSSRKQSWLLVGISHPTKKKIPIPGMKNPRGTPKVKNLYPRGLKSRIPGIKIPRLKKIPHPEDFQKIPKKSRCSENRKNPKFGFRDFWDFQLGIFRDFQIPGNLGFSGFFDLAQNKKFRSQLCT